MTEDFGLVSIVTPTYNSSRFIAETIDSIQKQTYGNWELLITDDCSTDDIERIVKSYSASDPRIRFFKLDRNSGPGVARNNSLKYAKGRFIAFCDSDDRWYPEKLEKQLRFMTGGDYALTYTSYDSCTDSGKICGRVECAPKITRKDIIRDCGVGCLTAIYDRDKLGLRFFPVLRRRQDWCLWIDIISDVGAAYGLREPLALYRLRKNSTSSNKFRLLKYNYSVYRDFLKYSHLRSAWKLFGCFLPYYFYKKGKQKIKYLLNR